MLTIFVSNLPFSSKPHHRRAAPCYPALDDCDGYASQTLPSGEVKGQRDLTASPQTYLGHIRFVGRCALDIGSASGLPSSHMEPAGVTASSLEPSMFHHSDVVPLDGFGEGAWRAEFSSGIPRRRNSFWYCHALLQSKARLFGADPYRTSRQLGEYGIGVLAGALLHTRSPLLLLEGLAARVKEPRVVVEDCNAALGSEASCRFVLHRGVRQWGTWWRFSPQLFASVVGRFGLSDIRVSFHSQQREQLHDPAPQFTLVANR